MKYKLKDKYINAKVIKVNETFILSDKMTQLELEHIYKMVGSEYVELVSVEEVEPIIEPVKALGKILKKHKLDVTTEDTEISE